jgi:hypothetical protein
MRTMRVLLATVLVALASAATASAALPPPGYHPSFPRERAGSKSSLSTCTVNQRGERIRSRKRFVPVACEQPPRSKVLDLGGSFWFGR